MKIKLTQAGYESLTGQFGSLMYTNGVSDEDVSEELALNVSAVIQCDIVQSEVAAAPVEQTTEVVPAPDKKAKE